MDDLREELEEVFGLQGFEPVAETFKVWSPDVKPDRKCATESCFTLVQSPRRLCDSCKAENSRASDRAQYHKHKARLASGGSGASQRHSLHSDNPADRRPSYEEEISRPHSEHYKRPVFGCRACIERARVVENPVSRRTR
jgi:hypothetical protein